MDPEQIKVTIRKNAAEIVRLHGRIYETVRYRQESPKKRLEWEQVCAEQSCRERMQANRRVPGES